MEKRHIEVFSAGCALCDDAIERVRALACDSCRVEVIDVQTAEGGERARARGVRSVPAVVVDGRVADCCQSTGITESRLRAAGVGSPK